MSNPRLQDITESEYQSWRHHPVTKLFLQYLGDYRESLIKEAVARWENGNLVLADEHEMRGRANTLREAVALQWHDIENFYGEEDPTNAA